MKYQGLFIYVTLATTLASSNVVRRQESPALVMKDPLSVPSGAPLQPIGVGAVLVATGTIDSPVKATDLAVSSGEPLAVSSGEELKPEEEQPKAETTTAEEQKAAEATTTTTAEAAHETAKVEKADGNNDLDLTVLNFAFTLERLETTFYQQAAEKISLQQWERLGISGAQAALISETLTSIVADETIHTSALQSTIKALGGEPNTKCTFAFGNSFDDPFTFLSVARTLEVVGVAAYAGGANLISDKSLLTTAATILSIESRHSTLLNEFAGASAVPQAFDIPLAPEQVLALAGGFLKDCNAADLGLTANQPLVAANGNTGQSLFSVGASLKLASLATLEEDKQFCQMIVGGAPSPVVLPLSNCVVPSGINGPVAVFVTSDDVPLSTDIVKQKKESIVAGPAMIFVDNPNNANAQLFTSILNVQQLATANPGILSIPSFVQNGQGVKIGKDKAGKDIEVKGLISQDKLVYYPAGGRASVYDRKVEGPSKVRAASGQEESQAVSERRKMRFARNRLPPA